MCYVLCSSCNWCLFVHSTFFFNIMKYTGDEYSSSRLQSNSTNSTQDDHCLCLLGGGGGRVKKKKKGQKVCLSGGRQINKLRGCADGVLVWGLDGLIGRSFQSLQF